MTPRYSLITATRDPDAPGLAWLRAQEGPDTELLIVPNPGQMGLGEAYNLGLAQARGRFCCFIHDDVEVREDGWLARLERAVAEDGYDLVGVAGSTLLEAGGAWWAAAQDGGRGEVRHRDAQGRVQTNRYGPPDDPRRGVSEVVALDGVLLFGARAAFEAMPFDTELFDGFHFYDSDLGLRWLLWAGRRLGVVHGLGVVHASQGGVQGRETHHPRFLGRHGGLLPLALADVPVWLANLAALRLMDRRTAAALTAGRRPGGRALFAAGDGGLEALEDPPLVLADGDGLPRAEPRDTLVFLGVGDGRLVERALDGAGRLLVVEPEGHLLAHHLAQRHWHEAIRERRLRFLVLPLEPAHLAELSLREAVVTLQVARRAAGGLWHWVDTGSTPLHRDLFRRLRAAVDGEGRAAQGSHGPGERPVYDVTVVSPSCAIFDDLAHCFHQAGYRTQLYRIPDRAAAWSQARWEEAWQALAGAPSRLTVVRNRVLLEAQDPGRRVVLEPRLPGRLLSWWWDVPNVASRVELDDPACQRPALAFAREILTLLPEGSRWLPPGAQSTFAAQPATLPEPDLPVTFVGQSRVELVQGNLNVLVQVMGELSGRVGPLLAADLNRLRGMTAIFHYLSAYRDTFEAAVSGFEEALPAVAYYLRYLWRMAQTGVFRLAAIQTLSAAGLPLQVYGDQGWLASGTLERAAFKGLLDLARLPELYRRSRVNLNLNFMQVASTVNPKVLDVCAAGGTVLTDQRLELSELFPDPALRPFAFAGLDDLPDRVADLLRGAPPGHRETVMAHVRERHTLAARARTIAAQAGL